MNDITTALKTAGVKLPSQMKRVWTYIKDHPNSTRDTLIKALKLPSGGVSSLLSQMVNRKMVNRKKERRICTRAGVSKPLTVWVYHTDLVAYEVLPAFEKITGKKKVTLAPESVIHLTPKEPAPALLTTWNIPDMKLSDARDLYLELKKYFGGAL